MATRTELDRWSDICRDHSTVIEFLTWLESAGVQLDFERADRDRFPTFDSQRFQELADAFFEVDRRRLERERRDLLASIQS